MVVRAPKTEEEFNREFAYEAAELLTSYSEAELDNNWQFKIVTGNFSTAENVRTVIQEQSTWGWTFVEKFDNNRIRFKRPASEVEKDAKRSGDPYGSRSLQAAQGCVLLIAAWVSVVACVIVACLTVAS